MIDNITHIKTKRSHIINGNSHGVIVFDCDFEIFDRKRLGVVMKIVISKNTKTTLGDLLHR